MTADVLSDRDQEDLSNTAADIEQALQRRDEIFTGVVNRRVASPSSFAPPTLDGAALLFSRYGVQDSGLFRVYEILFASPSDESALADLSRTFKSIPLYAGFISGVTAACLTIPGIFSQFTQSNQLTVWRTREMAKRQAMDHTLFTATKVAIGVGIKSYFLTAGFLYAPLLVSGYRGKSKQWDHALCFSITLGLFCLPRGPVPCLMGSGVGLSFGLLYGYFYFLAARKWGYLYEDLHGRRSSNV